MTRVWLAWLTFVRSGAWVAAVAVALFEASVRVLGAAVPLATHLTVFFGALGVYAFDRLVDDDVPARARDRFVRRHFVVQRTLAFVAVGSALACGMTLPRRVVAVFGFVVALALLHARLRRLPWIKPLYIATAWLSVVIGVPLVSTGGSWREGLAALLPMGLAIVANVLACDAADREAEALRIGVRRTWDLARAVAALGVTVALVLDARARELVWIPAMLLVALVPRRADEIYVSTFVDGALLVGAVIVLLTARTS